MPLPSTMITSRSNAKVKQLRAAFASNERLAEGLVAIEGENLVREALRSGLRLKTVFLSERTEVPDWIGQQVEVLTLTDEVFASAADTRHPQGVAALLEPPSWTMDAIAERKPLLLVLTRVQDPGNVGTLIRSAEAFGAAAVLRTGGTVSEWNQKALRASAGSVFRVPVIGATERDAAGLKSRGVRFFAAVATDEVTDNGSGPVTFTNADLTGGCALMIGNEGSGLDEQWLRLADERITIPMPGGVESLNAGVAGSLLLYEASRQRLEGDAGGRGGRAR